MEPPGNLGALTHEQDASRVALRANLQRPLQRGSGFCSGLTSGALLWLEHKLRPDGGLLQQHFEAAAGPLAAS